MRRFIAFIFVVAIFTSPSVYAGSGFGLNQEDEFSKNYRPTKINPFKGIKKVAIIPFFNMSKNLDPSEFSNAFAGIMENVPGWEALYPDIVTQVAAQNKIPLRSIHDALNVGRLLKVDAVFVGEIREFDPYFPPRIVLKVGLYKTLLRDRHEDIIQLSRSGVGNVEQRIDPYQAIWEYSARIDSRNKKVSSMVVKYAKQQNLDDSGFSTERFMRENIRFYEAVSFIISQDMIVAMKKPDEIGTNLAAIENEASWGGENPRSGNRRDIRRNRGKN